MAKEKETEGPVTSTVLSKSYQPLHNFPLPPLKWVTNHPNLHRFRKHYDSAPSGSPLRDSPSRIASPSNDSGSRMVNAGFPVAVSSTFLASSDHGVVRSEKNTSDERGRIVLRFRTKKCGGDKNDSGSDAVAERTGDQNLNSVEDADESPKMWNLRPRKVELKKSVGNLKAAGSVSRIGGAVQRVIRGKSSQTESIRSRTEPNENKNTKFSIALRKAEIEADIIAMTGSNPSSKPRKRARTLQKQLDFSFPGLWLDTITPSSYRVSDKPKKGIR